MPVRRRRNVVAKGPPRKQAAKKSDDADRSGSSSRSRSSSCSGSSYTGSDDDGSSGASGSESKSEDEDDPREYKRGGYHPVSAFQLYNARYRVLSKLGAGAFSTVWLCADEKNITPEGAEVVAMKVCKSKKSVTEQAEDEIALFEKLQEPPSNDKEAEGARHIVQLCGHFWHSGPNGRHKCLAFEVMGENLLSLVKYHNYDGLDFPTVRRIARHTLLGLEYIHSRGIVHTDVKLENVLLCRHDLGEMLLEARSAFKAFDKLRTAAAADAGLSKSQKKRAKKKQKNAVAAAATAAAIADDDNDSDDGNEKGAETCPGSTAPPVRQKVRFGSLDLDQIYCKLADFGNGCFIKQKVTDDIQTRQYRSPEIIIGQEWDETADIWSAACMFFELLTGDFLFDPRTGKNWTRDEDHVALIIELLGEHPSKEWALNGKYAKDFFTRAGKLKHVKSLKMWSLKDVLKEKYEKSEAEAREVADLLLPMLTWEPKDRWTAAQALQHRWLQPLPHEVDERFIPKLCPDSTARAESSSSPTNAPAKAPGKEVATKETTPEACKSNLPSQEAESASAEGKTTSSEKAGDESQAPAVEEAKENLANGQCESREQSSQQVKHDVLDVDGIALELPLEVDLDCKVDTRKTATDADLQKDASATLADENVDGNARDVEDGGQEKKKKNKPKKKK
eukprot:TRINITY_DN32492_c0_g1_i1.p1 TRINITY_DN32492_c0_g1~~TRINITY_DN32492_c0_g1_i1.p1  ORF type:complete len:677 (+),score=151.55 TRINITY_DN32492_c0_g1_i1:75-2105(+)